MSEDAVARHMQGVRTLSREGQPLSAGGARATVRNPYWFTPDGALTAPRDQLHEVLITHALDLPAQPPGAATPGSTAPEAVGGALGLDSGGETAERARAVVMAGPPGAGKSTVRAQLLGQGTQGWTVIDADAFKEGPIDAALADGSYQRWIKPPEVHALEAGGERFFPAEMSTLLQAESGLLAREQRLRAVAQGRDIVVDTVLWDARAALALGEALNQAGYAVDVVDVEVPYALSAARIAARWESVYRQALAGRDERGGRWVPSEYARIVYGGPGGIRGPSLCEASACELAERCPAVTPYRLFRAVPTLGVAHAQALATPAVLEVFLRRARAGGALVAAPTGGTTAQPRGARPTAPAPAQGTTRDRTRAGGTTRRAWSSAGHHSAPTDGAPDDRVQDQARTRPPGLAGVGSHPPTPSATRPEEGDEQSCWRLTSPIVSRDRYLDQDHEQDQELEP